MNMRKLAVATLFSSVSIAGATFADDTELYVVNASVGAGVKPNVLIIFDNSGSMSTLEQDAVNGYKPGETYAPIGSSNSYSGTMIYWTSGGIDNTSLPTPDSPSETRRFLDNINGCETAKIALNTVGFFTGFLREYRTQGKSGSWNEVRDNSGANYGYFDCWEDVANGKPQNASGIAQGYPADVVDRYNFTSSTLPSQAQINAARNAGFGTGRPITLYTDNYLRWYTSVTKGEQTGGTATRLEIAKGAISNVFESMSSSYNLGLAVFNMNYEEENSRDGGRIISGIKEMSASEKEALMSTISKMPAETNTPLCETLFEAYQYFSGGKVVFGNKDSDYNFSGKDKYIANQPPRDLSIEADGQYISPMKVCPEIAYVIYITDGVPTLDHAADDAITALVSASGVKGGDDLKEFGFDVGEVQHTSFLPALAAYMYHNDIVKGKLDAFGNDNQQSVRTYTIGFSEGAEEAEPLLKEAATRGGGTYSRALDASELTVNLTNTLSSILAIDSSFTSPSIASNNFDRTQTFDSAYYAMFLPSKGPRWSGNLKKLKVNSAGEIVGPGGSANAIDTNGNISIDTCTYWNTCSGSNDSNKVLSGGVLPTLQSQLKDRNIYTNSGANLISITATSFVSNYSQTDLDWLYGMDVDDDDNDDSTSDAREDIMGDPLHSKPLAINFGTATSLDVRIIVGTNQGLVHMFKDSDAGSADYTSGEVSESWAFIPNELWGNIPKLRENPATGVHSVYGMDLSPVAYVKTDDSDKKAWLFLGMRSGGASYYALDISSPDSPSFKWMINSDTANFEDLGQTWSQPVVAFLKGVSDPVLIFGGGMASAQGTGQAVYIVNANTGAFITKFTDSGMGSIVTKVAVLDSDNDGYTDRIYASDITGNVWRMDLAGVDSTKWTVFKFASIAGVLPADNRMFFAEPVIAQTEFNNVHSDGTTLSYQKVPYDAVAIGSGNRDHPLDVVTNDMFYIFQDRNVVTQNFATAPATLTVLDLYNVTNAAPTSESDNLAFGQKRGWYYDFVAKGEKSLSASLIFDGKVYFTSFVPPTNQTVDLDAGVCGFSGQGRLYVFDLHKGTRTTSEPYYEVGERVPDTPQIVIPKPEDGKDAEAYIIGVGKGECENGECKGTIGLGGGLDTNKIYYHINE